MKILEDEGGFERHCFQVAERLRWLFAVVERLRAGVVGFVPFRRPCPRKRWPDSGTNSPTSLPQRTSPLAMLHSKVARFSEEQAARTSRTALVSSTVSITTMGVEELSRIFRRSSASAIKV